MHEQPALVVEDMPGATKLSLVQDGAEIAHLFIFPFVIRIGRAVVRVDGIGDVWTEEAHRRQGHARQLMEAAVRRMRQGDAALAVLYGIADFYPKFGFAAAGAEQLVVLNDLHRSQPLAPGWRARRATPNDLAQLQVLYDTTTVTTTGAAVRERVGTTWAARPWAKLAEALTRDDAEECRVVEAPDGRVVASCWRGADAVWFVRANEEWSPQTLAFAEVLAENAPAAEAVLATCRAWAIEEGQRRAVKSVTFGVPLEGLIGRTAAFQDADRTASHHRTGGFMARTLDPQRLLTQLQPELTPRLDVVLSGRGALRITTEEGTGTLHCAGDGSPAPTAGDAAALTVALPQTTLAQLALGAFPPADLLARLAAPVDPATAERLCALFPERQPHIFPPDRP